MINEDYIPKIDLTNLIAHGVNLPEAQNTIQKIKKASEEVGFFTVTNHGVSSQSIDKITTTARSFFHLPLDKKLTIAPKKWNKNTDTVYRGYFPSEVNGKEGLDIGDPLLTHDMTDLTQKEKFEVNHDMSSIDQDW
ncbi:MAG: 2-oxoglutarate and iron-dependent oxygenase domain-containing protein [Proteobacteria bacterium]|nr:2-oxoglutarate and iron-dependent oxygenase domain-containing protein [Pseudomonadota bacterium]